MTVDQGPDNKAGATRTFRTSRTTRKVIAIALGVMLLPVLAVAFTPAARQSGLNTWGGLALVGFFVVALGGVYAAVAREAVIVRGGKVVVRNVLSHSFDVTEIRAVTAGQVSRHPDVPGPLVPEAELTNGTRILMHALTLGSSESIAAYNEFRVLVGLAQDPEFGDAASEHASDERDDG